MPPANVMTPYLQICHLYVIDYKLANQVLRCGLTVGFKISKGVLLYVISPYVISTRLTLREKIAYQQSSVMFIFPYSVLIKKRLEILASQPYNFNQPSGYCGLKVNTISLDP